MPSARGAGGRSRYVRIEQLVDTSADPPGFPREPWERLTDVWMHKSDIVGDERFMAEQLAARYEATWEMAYQANMDPEAIDIPKSRRLVYKGRTYDITHARPIGIHDRIELMTIAATRVS